MDARIVAGVGNIYANEALFVAGVDPRRAGGRIARRRVDRLVVAIRQVLGAAIDAGGTTLRDYVRTDGAAGEFVGRLGTYGREGEPCPRCAAPIAGRSSGNARPGSAGDASGEPGSAGRRQAACPVRRRYFANSASGVST